MPRGTSFLRIQTGDESEVKRQHEIDELTGEVTDEYKTLLEW
jgi:hypothetical protein